MRVLTPELGDAATACSPCALSFFTSFEPMSPVPPITTIFIIVPFLSYSTEAFKPPVVLACESGARTTNVAKLLNRCYCRPLEESEQLRIDLILESRTHAVRSARKDFQCGPLNDFGRDQTRCADGHDLIVIAV